MPKANKHHWKKVIRLLILAFITAKCIGCYAMVPHPWGNGIHGDLPGNHSIHVKSRVLGNNVDFQIHVNKGDKTVGAWVCKSGHASSEFVTIRYYEKIPGEIIIVIELSKNEFISIDLASKDCGCFTSSAPEQATKIAGIESASGYTGFWLSPLLPW